ncbi:MAG: hypothetical protein Q4G24_02250 [Paracoccus sp. (in: a-proteobacteria)]|uniref:hypothetical protein n=1 Tax=Paracoccus sp. TaxID=267 RepID=UPI0026DFCDA8|nr:hypothetical protein [Paracoccus sp. (in: a-proteobacteria)]MDO5620274.1 hypothetical protein [Paracoccus sp. (in: a-proteobacteria)]
MTKTIIFLMPWGRVGSNLVNSIIQSSRAMRVFNEPLTGIMTRTVQAGGSGDEIWKNQREWLETEMLPGQRDTFLNLAANCIAEPDTFRDIMAPLAPTYLVLDRKDDLATAISALRTEAWVSEGREKGEHRSWAIPKGQAVDFRPVIPVGRLRQALTIIRQGRDHIQRITQHKIPVTYYYEDLVEDMAGTLTDILYRCGIPRFDFEVRSAKFGDADLSKMVGNAAEIFDEVRRDNIRTALTVAGQQM